MTDPRTLTDDALLARVAALTAAARETTAELIAHLVELEDRNLHLACGFRSLYGYCRSLRFSEGGSYNRMEAAHAARRFPVILPMLAEGLLHLTAVRLLAPHLGDENHLALLGGAIHKSRREVDELLARWFPRPSVRESIRTVSVAGRDLVAPLSEEEYEIRMSVRKATIVKLRRAQELLSHVLPRGEIAEIFDRGLTFVIADSARRRHSATDRPRPVPIRPPAAASRHISAHVERAVWERDDGQCSFVSRTGLRCGERSFLEYHHLTPWAAGGTASVENIALRCRAHNQYEARVFFDPIRRAMADTP
jgi:hypothetical protein